MKLTSDLKIKKGGSDSTGFEVQIERWFMS